MKYLDNPLLIHLSNTLSNVPTPEASIHVRFEAYSVKPIGRERKMYKEMEEAYMSGQEEMDEMSFSPEMREAGLSSCFGRLDEKESRKVHFLLVSTLNAAFPDHDFNSLQPNQFTREPSAAHVLANVSTSLLGPGPNPQTSIILGRLASLSPSQLGSSAPGSSSAAPLSGSPSNPPSNLPSPDLYRLLNDVVALDDCEVYSWFPEPEYDPHYDPEDGEVSENGMGFESDEDAAQDGEMEMMTDDVPASWGAGGMELDDVPASFPMDSHEYSSGKEALVDSTLTGSNEGRPRRAPHLLWSQNYFFYSRRQKRVLLLTCWCRTRPSQFPSPPSESTDFPLPISSSFTPSAPAAMTSNAAARHLHVHRHHRNARLAQRKSKLSLKTEPIVSRGGGKEQSTIPIRGMEVPGKMHTPARLAASAPSTFNNASPQAALAKMTAGGFKPRQTPARVMMNSAAASNRKPLTGTTTTTSGVTRQVRPVSRLDAAVAKKLKA